MNQKSKSAGSNVGDDTDATTDKTVPGASGRRRKGLGLKPDTTLQGAKEQSDSGNRGDSPRPGDGRSPGKVSADVRPEEPW